MAKNDRKRKKILNEYFAIAVEDVQKRMYKLELLSREELADWASSQVALSLPWEIDQAELSRLSEELGAVEYEKVLRSDLAFAEWLRRWLAEDIIMPETEGAFMPYDPAWYSPAAAS